MILVPWNKRPTAPLIHRPTLEAQIMQALEHRKANRSERQATALKREADRAHRQFMNDPLRHGGGA